MKRKLRTILACPLCHGPLVYKSGKNELICEVDRLAYPVRNGIPVLLNADARSLDDSK
ncbi:MAG: Trm112 family protein [Gammaproteobacteria bacterium]